MPFEARDTATKVSAGSVIAEGPFIVEDAAGLVQTPVGPLETFRSVKAWALSRRFRQSFHLGFRTFVDVLLAVLPPIARVAFASVIFDQIHALGSMEARGSKAIVHVDLAVVSSESRVIAVAMVRVDTVDAKALVQTRRGLPLILPKGKRNKKERRVRNGKQGDFHSGQTHVAFVDVDLASRAREAWQADAGEGGDPVDASAVILARRGFALVNVNVAILARKSRSADALVAVDEVVASSVVLARMRKALVEFQVAVVP